jgi:hypothetical protein
MIFQVGLESQLMACTDSPENGPLIHLIDLNILTIQSTLDPPGGFFNIIQPDWQVLGGFDNRIYAFVSKSQDVIADLPPINEETETFILIYDVDQSEWSYIVDSAERTQYDPKNVGHRGSKWCDTGSNFRQNDLFSVESSLFPTKVDYRGYWLLRFLMEPYIKKHRYLINIRHRDNRLRCVIQSDRLAQI